MRRWKFHRFLAVLVFTAVPLVSTSAEQIGETLTLTPTAPVAEDALLPRAAQLEELLIIEIVDFRVFDIRMRAQQLIDEEANSEADAPSEEENVEGAVTDPTASADYLLTTSYTTSDSADVWTVGLVSSRTGRTVFSTARSISNGDVDRIIPDIAQQLRQIAMELILAQPEDVYTLVGLGQFSQAEQLLNRMESRDSFSEPNELEDLRALLDEARGARAYEAAIELLESGYVSEAAEFAARAVARQPSNTTYQDLAVRIRDERAQMETNAVIRRAEAAEELINAGLFSAAEAYIDLTEDEYPDSVDLIAEQRETASVGAQAREAYNTGMSAFWTRNYERAYAHLQHAVDLDPEREEYREMLSTTGEALEELERTETLSNEYQKRVASIHPTALWLTPRAPRSAWQAGLGRGRIRWDRTDSASGESYEIRQWVIEGSIRYPRSLNLLRHFDSTTVFWYWSAGGTLRFGGNENDYDSWADSDSDFYRLNAWSVAPFGGIGLMTNVASFAVQTGIRVDPQLLVLHELNRNTVLNEDTRDSAISLVPSISLDFALHWYLNREDSLILQIQHPIGSTVLGRTLENSERWHSGSVILSYSKGFQ